MFCICLASVANAFEMDNEPGKKTIQPLPQSLKNAPAQKKYKEGVSGAEKPTTEKKENKDKKKLTGLFWKAEHFTLSDGAVIAYGNVMLRSGKLELKTDHMVFYQSRMEVYAEGNIIMSENNRVLYADKIYYNFKTGSGIVSDARVITYSPWEVSTSIASGWRVFCTKPGDYSWSLFANKLYKYGNSMFLGESATSSPSGFGKPLFKIRSKKIRFMPNHKAASTHNVIFAGPIPVFYFPYLVKDLSGRWPWINIALGQTKEWKQYVFAKVGYKIRKHSELLIDLDYRRRQGMAGGIGLNYSLDGPLKGGRGTIRSYYIDEREKGERGLEYAKLAADNDVEGRERYKIEFQHTQPFNFSKRFVATRDWTLNAEIYKYSDKYFRAEYFEQEALTARRENNLTLMKSTLHTDFELLTQFRVNRWLSETNYLPEARFRVLSWPIKESGFYYSSATQTGFIKYMYDESLERDDVDSWRAHTEQTISYLARLGTALKLEPYVGGEFTFYENTLDETDDSLRDAFLYGAELSSRIMGLFEKKSTFWDLNKLRHVITPGIRFTGRTRPNIKPAELFQFDTIDAHDKSNMVTVFLRNNFYTKRGNDKHISEFASVEIQFNGYPDSEEAERLNDGHFLGEIGLYWRLRPRDFMTFAGDVRFDPQAHDPRVINFGFTLEPTKQWSLFLGHRYFRTDQEDALVDDSSESSLKFTYRINERWAIRISGNYEFFDREIPERGHVPSGFTEQKLTLFRRQGSWQFSMSYFRNSVVFPVDEGIFFAIGLVGEEPFFGRY